MFEDDWERMVTFYDFPEAHWQHLRTTNVIESPFASVRLRTHGNEAVQAGGERNGPDLEAPDGGREAVPEAERSRCNAVLRWEYRPG